MAERTGSNDVLSRKRIVLINGEIREEIVENIAKELLRLEAANPTEDITIFINSPGGSVIAGLAIHDIIKMIRCQVSTICYGQAASMAAVLLMAGDRGKRFISPNARVLIHQPSGGAFGTATEIETTALEITRLKNRLNGLVSAYTGQPIEQVAIDMERDFYLDAEGAVRYGVVDAVRFPGEGAGISD
ncbi:MAG: ATP-dependent Clp protease proteolytic subunit [Armatimonadetes bacterium]|nr:ATP-dependent Clp protease proteolytic subunit [Armatimonadota bacterium]